jgi:hypothetical protein
MFHSLSPKVILEMLLPSRMALNQGYGDEENKEKAYDLGNSYVGEHQAIRPETFNPESTEGIEQEIGEKYIAPDYALSPSDP